MQSPPNTTFTPNQSRLYQQFFFKTPTAFKKSPLPPSLPTLPHTETSKNQTNSLIFSDYLKKRKNHLILMRKKPCFSIQGFSSKDGQNVVSEFSYFQQISNKILQKKQKEFENPNSELPEYYLPTLQAFNRKKDERKPLVFLDSLRKMCPFFEIDPIILTRILLACDINPNNRFSPVSWPSFQRISRVLFHKNATFDEKCDFLIAFFAGKANFNDNEQISAFEINGLLGKMANFVLISEKPEELCEIPSLKEVLLRDLEESGAFDRRTGLSIRRFREALKRKVIDIQQYLQLIMMAKC